MITCVFLTICMRVFVIKFWSPVCDGFLSHVFLPNFFVVILNSGHLHVRVTLSPSCTTTSLLVCNCQWFLHFPCHLCHYHHPHLLHHPNHCHSHQPSWTCLHAAGYVYVYVYWSKGHRQFAFVLKIILRATHQHQNNDHHDVNLEIINVRRHIDVKTSKLLFHLLRVDLGSKNYIICRMIEWCMISEILIFIGICHMTYDVICDIHVFCCVM